MSIYRQNNQSGKAENTISVRSGKSRRTWLHVFAVMLFCMILNIGTVVFAEEVPATVIVAGAKIRATADKSSEALAGVKNGDTLSICGQTTGVDGNIWYQVYVDADTKGFIRSDLIQKNTNGNITTVPNENPNANTTITTNTTETQATAVEKKNVTVVSNGVRIRKGASTQYDVVATANRGMVLTITGEAAGGDGKTWYQVSFSYNNKEITGFIRSDLVTFDHVPADTAVSEITGTEETPDETTTETTPEATTEPVTEEQSQEPEQKPEDENANIILMNVEEEVYVLPEFTPIILKWEGQDINAFKNGKFYLFYAQKQNGDTGWFLYDAEKGVYQRYVYDTGDATIPKESTFSENILLIIILVVVIVILLAIIGLMFLKLREYTSDYYDDEYDEDDDEEDDDEEFEEEKVQQPVKRPERSQQLNRPQQGNGQQSQRRPERLQPQQKGNGQPVRRPQQGNGQQMQRRPQQESGQVLRRPQQGGNGQQPRRQPSEPQPKRPIKGNQNQQLQNGRRAKNFLEADDDDMEFIDI